MFSQYDMLEYHLEIDNVSVDEWDPERCMFDHNFELDVDQDMQIDGCKALFDALHRFDLLDWFSFDRLNLRSEKREKILR